MAGACAVAIAVAAPSPAASSISSAAPRRSFRVGCRRAARSSASGGRARFSRNPAEADPGKGRIPQNDSSYLWTLGLGSVGAASAIKYGSILLPDITRPNIVQALLMVSLPVAAAVLILLKASSTED